MSRFPIRLALLLVLGSVAAAPAMAIEMPIAVLQGLDKVTARVSTIEVRIGETVRFGTLEITARACDKTPPEEPPEAAAFLEIAEVRPGEAPIGRFSGWMFASSPALSALEHPVYDIWVVDCRADPPAPSSPSPGTPSTD